MARMGWIAAFLMACVAGDLAISKAQSQQAVRDWAADRDKFVLVGGRDDAGIGHRLRMTPDGRVLAECR